jgi:RNA recognition motif-containing protein
VLKLRVANLPPDTTEQEFTALFAVFGRVHSMQLSCEIFTGKCRGFGSLEMEGHEARAAIAGLNGKDLRGQLLKVGEDRKDGNKKQGFRRR